MNTFRLPDDTKRTLVLGRTGSGKTVFVKWLISHQPLEQMPFTIIDYKHNGEFDDIPYAKPIDIGELPKQPGLYIMTPDFDDELKIDRYFYDVLRQGNRGTVIDEGMSAPQAEPRYRGLRTLLAQGRSKHAPVIVGSQRPVRINRSILSEGDFFARFHLSFGQDLDYVREFMPDAARVSLDEYNCHWYDVGRNAHHIVRPVAPDETLERLQSKLRPKRTFL